MGRAASAGRSRSESEPATGPGWTARVPRIVVVTLVCIAVLCALAAVGAAFRGGMQPVRESIDLVLFPAPANLGYAAFLFVLAAALGRRKRIAYWILLLVLAAQLVLSVLTLLLVLVVPLEPGVVEQVLPGWLQWSLGANAVVTTGAMVVLGLASRQFYGRVQRASVPKALVTFAGLVAVFIGLGYGLVWLFPGSLHGPADVFSWTVERVLGGAVTLDITRTGEAPGWVNLVLGTFGMATLFAALAVLFRSQRTASVLPAADERRVRALLAEHGEVDSLGYFATRRDKAVLFSTSGKAAVSYRVVGGVCLASGDPLGDPEAWGPAIERWLGMCRDYTWRPAVIGAGERGARAYARAGLKVLRLGDEAVLELSTFTLEGREMRPVRQAVNRLHRAGYRVRIRRQQDISAEEMTEVSRRAARWRGSDAERGFSMALGRWGDRTDGGCVLVEAVSADGEVCAMLSFVPWGRTGLSLEAMRRAPGSDNGLVELMISSVARSGGRGATPEGMQRISLNFAVFREAFEEGARLGAGPVLRFWRGILLFLSRWWQLESLYRSNAKYLPDWVPRFIGFRDRRDLARVGFASAVAEGFVPLLGSSAGPDTAAPGEDRMPVIEPHEAEPRRRSVPEQMRVRLDKVAKIRADGGDPYPVQVPRTDSCAEIADRHAGTAPDIRTGERTAVTGRVVLMRDHGRLCFATLRGWSGQLQVMVTTSDTGADRWRAWKDEVDIGDQVSVQGEVITTRHGETTVLADEWTLASKCLRPLPDKHAGLTDPETRARARAVDLIVGTDSRVMLRARSDALQALRSTLTAHRFLEVETPILQPVHGGASAQPFRTHINAYDMPLYLRIAPELYLKRLCVGGVERVFELGRTFRNEGVSARHNPEFTMLEAYQAHADYRVMRELCEQLVQAAATAVHGAPVARRQGAGEIEEIDLSGSWPAIPVHEALSSALGEEITPETSPEHLRSACERMGLSCEPDWPRGAFVVELYEHLVERRTTRPTFYTDFPVDVSPLTRPHRDDPRLAERWDLVAFGVEIGTAYSELVDPIEQRRRLTEQSLQAAGGDPEAMELDEDFLRSLEFAMPPTGGLGLGVDRLLMLLTGRPIRDTLPFPLVRPARGR
ncbi:bifunctional lysylphosphatidylglycerol synthetase/lysine--tRNA ligase LysX [Saccharopolyspora tripterygii]